MSSETLHRTRLLLVCVSLILPHIVTAQDKCVSGDLRLVEVGQSNQPWIVGLVEYCMDGNWSTVCTNSPGRWGPNETVVTCRQLGYLKGDHQQLVACTTSSSPSFIRLNCPNSSVSNLQECGVMEVEDCHCTVGDQSIHAVALCNKDCTDGTQRLVGGSSDREGRVEVCVDGRWGTVQTSQPRQLAEAVCRNISLTLESYTMCLGTQYGYRLSKPVYHCDVTENNTLTCRDEQESNHTLDLGVVCGPPPDDELFCNNQFRLTNGSTNREGRVEVCMDGRWGTVCNNSQEGIAGAVCSQLGFPAEGAVSSQSPQISSDWPETSYYCYSNITCIAISNDTHCSKLSVHCSSHQDVVAKKTFCADNQEGHFRLVNGSSPNEGRVEVCMNGGWRPVCDSGKNDTALAASVCSVLGYSEEDAMLRSYEIETQVALCCYYSTNEVSCEECRCNHTIQVECQTWQELIKQITYNMCSKPEPSLVGSSQPSVTVNMSQDSSHSVTYDIITPLGAVSGILAALLVATVVGWMVTCVVRRRSSTHKRRLFINVPDLTMHSYESYSAHQLDHHTHSTAEPTLASLYSMGPNCGNLITRERLDTYDVVDYNEQSSNTQEANLADNNSVEDETSKKGDDFSDVKGNTCAVEDKKKISVEDEEGREESLDCEAVTPGETLCGVIDKEPIQ